MTSSDTLDFDLITTLLAHVGRLNGPDRRLGLRIIAAAEPTTELGSEARRLLSQPQLADGDVPPAMDITGSTDAAFDFYERHLGHAEWSMFRMEGRFQSQGTTRKRRAEGPYHIQIETPDVIYCGDGWTRPTCVVNGVLRTFLPLHGGAANSPNDIPIDETLLQGLDGLIPRSED